MVKKGYRMQHLAIIPDGNRRWAAQHKLESLLGHRKGVEVFRTAMKFCLDKGIKFLSVYTFSLENFRRSEGEKSYLFSMIAEVFVKELPELIKNQVCVRFVGDRARFPVDMREVIERIETTTKDFTGLTVSLLFCYGSRGEVTATVKDLAQRVKDGTLTVDAITDQLIQDSLWTGNIPDPDLVIRTGGAMRTSNFMLLQTAYSEWMFVDEFWPELTEAHFAQCVEKFNTVKRNFGS